MLQLQPRLKPSLYVTGLTLAFIINALLILFIYQLVIKQAVIKPQETITLNFRQFNSKETVMPEHQPEQLAQVTKKPALKQLSKPKLSISVNSINSINALSFPAMKAEEFSINPSLLSIELPDVQAKESITVQVNSGLISATPVFQLPPQYPPRAKQKKIEGYVVMQIYIESSGKVSDIKVLEETPKGIFANSAMKAAYRWRFQPPEKNSNPWQILKVRYELKK